MSVCWPKAFSAEKKVKAKSLPFGGAGRGRFCAEGPLRALQKNLCKERNRYGWQIYPLENYLRDLPDRQREVTLGFEQIERILNAKLPSSAYEYWAWWASEKEGNHVNARAWVNAGWKIENVDFSKKRVKLVRVG